MNILFITLTNYHSIEDHDIYSDLLREFRKNGHKVYLISPAERRYGEPTRLIEENDATILKVKTLNIQKTNIVEKGFGTLLIESQIVAAIRKYLSSVRFDLVLYSTPPITFANAVKYVKTRDNAKTYLLLKDIFPQNAVDIGMMKTSGLTGILYRFFRKKEKQLYALSDYIGCMSQANADYVVRHNPEIDPKTVSISPNCIEVTDMRLSPSERAEMRKKYGLPQDKKIFVYGGNLGRPQGIPFIIDCLRAEKEHEQAVFLIVGTGTEFSKLKAFTEEEKPKNVILMNGLPKDEYDRMVASCDVGMVFLDHRFTIPNFPSRLLAYMQAGLPVLACTDPNTDFGKTVVDGGFGWWCESNDVSRFCELVSRICHEDTTAIGETEFAYLRKEYDVSVQAKKILEETV